MVLDYRQLSKLKSTYVDALPALLNSCTRRLHTTFNMAGSATGRLSSVNPNLQNIPIRTELGREIRAAFIAEPGHVLLAADYSQIELRLLAHFSGDKLLVEAYRTGRGHPHADRLAGLRRAAADGERRASPPRQGSELRHRVRTVAIWTFAAARHRHERSQALHRRLLREVQRRARVHRPHAGAGAPRQKVTTLFGRVRPIPDIHSKNFNLRGFAERTAVNTPLQGTAADLIKLAMIRIDAELRERKLRSRMLLQVHDELVFEVPEDEVDTMKRLVTDTHGKRPRTQGAAEGGSWGGAELAGPGVTTP